MDLIQSSSFHHPSEMFSPLSPRRKTTKSSSPTASENYFMQSGRSYLMMNLLMLTGMVSSWNVSMVSAGEYILVFTYSADYPEKWELYVFFLMGSSDVFAFSRVLLATVQDKGNCACPHCLIPKSMFHCTGLMRDIAARLSRARTHLLDKVNQARHAIYVLGQLLKGSTVEILLKYESLIPILVS